MIARETRPEAMHENPLACRVAIVGTVGLPARYGGFETLAHFLVLYLGKAIDFTVYCSGIEYQDRESQHLDARLKYFPFKANGAQSVIFDLVSLIHAFFTTDVLLVLGVSGGIFLPLARLLRKRVVLNIGGIEWQRSKWGSAARRFLKLSEAVAVNWADLVVADNEGIVTYLKAEYGVSSVLIEYGGDQATTTVLTEENKERYPFLKFPYAFSVARIQKDNNIEMVLEAFSQLPSYSFVLVGNWNRTKYGLELKSRFEHYENLHLLEAIYNSAELNCLRGHCSIYIHGHSAGGTNPALVEAMHLSLPIVAFDVVFNRTTTEYKACYFRDAHQLRQILTSASSTEWRAQGLTMKTIANKRYRWELIANKYAQALFNRNRAVKVSSPEIENNPKMASK